MYKFIGVWIPFSGESVLVLGSSLFAIASALLFLGFKLKKSIKIKTPGNAVAFVLIVIWYLSILIYLDNIGVYLILWKQSHFPVIVPSDPIANFTLFFALISFGIILFINRKQRKKVAILSALVAALAGPMIFEAPFDFIVVSRTYPPLPPNPVVARGLDFFPLFLIELTTLSLLLISPFFNVNKYTFFALAAMFFIFSFWAFLGFSYADNLTFLLLNVFAKAMSFMTVITLFLPKEV